MTRLSSRTLMALGIAVFALFITNPASAQFEQCVGVCGPNTPCTTGCNIGTVATNCGDGGFVCIPPCANAVCTSSIPCGLPCIAGGNVSTCGGQGLPCCPGDQLINRIRLCKAQFFKPTKGICVLIKRFDDTYEKCNGMTFDVNPDDFPHYAESDAASCPSICEPGCEDLCR